MNILANILSQPALFLEPNAFNSHALFNGSEIVGQAHRLPAAKTCCDDCGNEIEPTPRHERILEIITPPQMGAVSTAIIHVDGFIVKHVEPEEAEMFGLVDLDDVDAALTEIDNAEEIQNVILDFRTWGGTVIGIPETADRIYDLAKRKNIKSFTDSMCCSGGIYLATQANEFFVTQSAHTGSIGAIRPPILDISKMLKAQGVEVTIIKAGKYKDTGTQLRPVTDDEKKMLDAYVARVNAMFNSAVLRNRRMTADNMQGQIFFGDQAIEVGLADAVLPDLAAALAQF